MPEPGPRETKDEFLKRCIPQVVSEGTAKGAEQAAAICFDIWRRKNDGRDKKDK